MVTQRLQEMVRAVDQGIQRGLVAFHEAKVEALNEEVDDLADAVEPVHDCWRDTGEHRAVVDAHLPLFKSLQAKDQELKQAKRELGLVRQQGRTTESEGRVQAAVLLMREMVLPQIDQAKRSGQRQVTIDLNGYNQRMQITISRVLRFHRPTRLDDSTVTVALG